MFALYLAIFMDGYTCDAVAVCDEAQASCEAIVLHCDGPVRLEACLNEAAAYTDAQMHDPASLNGELEPLYALGCATDVSQGWPASVDFDRDDLERAY